MAGTQTGLLLLQDIRAKNLGNRYSPVFAWAINVAISVYIGMKPDEYAEEVLHLADAIRKEAVR